MGEVPSPWEGWVNTRLYILDGGMGGIEGVRAEGLGWARRDPKHDGCPSPKVRGRHVPRRKGQRSEKYEEHHLRQSRRAKAKVRRLIKANRLRYMMTLTSANGCSLTEAQGRFWKMSRELKRRGIRWLGVVEFQKRGAAHLHVATDRWIPWEWIWKWWSPEGFKAYEDGGRKGGWDFVYIVGPRHGTKVGKAAGYISKYIVKGADDERLRDHHSYLRPRGLREPEMVEAWTTEFAHMLMWMADELKDRVRNRAPWETDYIWDLGEVQAAGLSPP